MSRRTWETIEDVQAELLTATPTQQVFAAQAVRRQQEADAALELFVGLTDRERAIAWLAWQRAETQLVERLHDLLGPAAVTVDADAIRRELALRRGAPSFRVRRYPARFLEGTTDPDPDDPGRPFAEEPALELCRDVLAQLEHVEGASS